jgi:hypothetical protein
LFPVVMCDNVSAREAPAERPQAFVAGNLLLTKGLDAANRPTLKAQLLTDTGALALPSLEHARVTRITGNGIAIAGTEIVARRKNSKASADCWPQTGCVLSSRPVWGRKSWVT